jgi:hypothetical protein
LELGLTEAQQDNKHSQRLVFIHGYAHQLLEAFLLFALAEAAVVAVATTALAEVEAVALLTPITLL